MFIKNSDRIKADTAPLLIGQIELAHRGLVAQALRVVWGNESGEI